ncbi:MAG: hypothetical protein ACE5DI_06265 [Candidatus Micrarchaeia archaeon]
MTRFLGSIGSDNRIALFIFVLVLSVYVFSAGGQLYSSDVMIAISVSSNFFHTGSFDMSKHPVAQTIGYCKTKEYCAVPRTLGSVASFLPFVFLEQLLTDNGPIVSIEDVILRFWPIDFVYGTISLAFLAFVFFYFCRELGASKNHAFVLTLACAFSTIVWTYGETPFNLVLSTPLLFSSIFLVFRAFKNNSSNDLLLSGLVTGLLVTMRFDGILFAFLLFLFVASKTFKNNKKLLFSWLSPVLFFLLIVAIYNAFVFGSIFSFGYEGSNLVFDVSLLFEGVYGLLFSPGAGLLFFSPLCFFGLFFLFDLYKKHSALALLILSFFIVLLLFYGVQNFWHGWLSWGPRYLLSVVPLLLLPLAVVFKIKSKNAAFLGIFLLLALAGFLVAFLSVSVNWVASYNYAGGISSLIEPGEIVPSKAIYDFSNSQISYHWQILTGQIMNEYADIFDFYLYREFGLLSVLLLLFVVAASFLYLRPFDKVK